jgi:hypothetical protein
MAITERDETYLMDLCVAEGVARSEGRGGIGGTVTPRAGPGLSGPRRHKPRQDILDLLRFW